MSDGLSPDLHKLANAAKGATRDEYMVLLTVLEGLRAVREVKRLRAEAVELRSFRERFQRDTTHEEIERLRVLVEDLEHVIVEASVGHIELDCCGCMSCEAVRKHLLSIGGIAATREDEEAGI